MSTTPEELKSKASNVLVSERAELVDYLLHSLGARDEKDASLECLALAKERMNEIRTGQVVGVPVEQVMGGLRRPQP